jgi:hypothetical protein
MTDRLIVAATDPAAWQRALSQVLDIAFSQRQLLFALERNENTFRERLAGDADIGARLTNDPASLAGLLANRRSGRRRQQMHRRRARRPSLVVKETGTARRHPECGRSMAGRVGHGP